MISPTGETVENKRDRRIWLWGECVDDALSAGLKMGALEFWVYYKIRVYETHGKYGFSVASDETLAKNLTDEIGLETTAAQVLEAKRALRKKGALAHILSDKKVYRNKAKLDVTDRWCEEYHLNATDYMLGEKGRKPMKQLGDIVNSEGVPPEAEGVSPESPLMNNIEEQVGESNNKNNKESVYAYCDNDGSETPSAAILPLAQLQPLVARLVKERNAGSKDKIFFEKKKMKEYYPQLREKLEDAGIDFGKKEVEQVFRNALERIKDPDFYLSSTRSADIFYHPHNIQHFLVTGDVKVYDETTTRAHQWLIEHGYATSVDDILSREAEIFEQVGHLEEFQRVLRGM